MKEIMKEHGGLLVTVAVTICILTIIFSAVTDSDGNRGIVKIIAAHMNTDGTDYNAYADYGAYQTEIAKDAPVIEMCIRDRSATDRNQRSSLAKSRISTSLRLTDSIIRWNSVLLCRFLRAVLAASIYVPVMIQPRSFAYVSNRSCCCLLYTSRCV